MTDDERYRDSFQDWIRILRVLVLHDTVTFNVESFYHIFGLIQIRDLMSLIFRVPIIFRKVESSQNFVAIPIPHGFCVMLSQQIANPR